MKIIIEGSTDEILDLLKKVIHSADDEIITPGIGKYLKLKEESQ